MTSLPGEAAVEAAAQTRSRAALFNHMSYVAYKAFQSGSAQHAREKSRRQQAIFERATWLFPVGPLLRDELSDLVRGSQPHMIVPGLPEIDPVEPPKRWTMVLFGRLNPETDRIKQGRLGVAAFARAYRDAWKQPGLVSTSGPACDNAALQRLFRILCGLYLGCQGLQPLRPDVLGERLVARILALSGDSRPAILSSLLGSKSNEAVRRHTLTVMTRLAQHSPQARPVLLEALQEHFVPCVGSIVEVSLETRQPLPELSVAAFESLPYQLKAQASRVLSERVPYPSVKLAELALRLDEFRLVGARAASERRKADEKSSDDLARSLNNTGVRLEDLGRFEEASERAREAHAIYTRLADLNPLRYADDLLRSELWLQFLAWHARSGDPELPATWAQRARQTELPDHRRELLVAWHALVEACLWDHDRPGSGIEKMDAVVASFATMAAHQRRPLEPYHLIAAAYLAQHAPNLERAEAYAQAWRNFLDAHGNHMPATVTESLKGLNCAPLTNW